MKTKVVLFLHRLFSASLLALALLCLGGPPVARAGLQIDMHLYGAYYCFPWLSTNSTSPSPTNTAYFVWSPSSTINSGIHFQLNPDNTIDGSGSSVYSDYTSFIHEITNGNWTLLVTNAAGTNQYSFTVTVPATITSNLFAPVVITSPASGQVNVAKTPTFTWTGPVGWQGTLNVEDDSVDNNGNNTYFTSASLTPDQTSWPSPASLPNGTNNFSVNYVSNTTASVTVSTPVDNLSNPFPGFSFISTLESDANNNFVVGSATELVVNGGFETGDFTGWTDDGSSSVGTDSTAVHSGTYGVENGSVGSLGYLSQTLATTPGATYLLSFWLNSPDGQTPNEFQVSWNGTVLFDETNLPALGWTNMQFVVTATSASTVLQFGFQDDPAYLGLDDVSVAPTSGQDFNAAFGTTNLNWTTSGDTGWFVETTNTYNGAPSAAQSGSVINTQTSTLSVTVTGPGTLTYYWSTIASGSFSCEFDVDGNYSNNITGNTAWYQDGPYSIGAGQHTLSWTAYANGDTDPTEAGFLDQVSFVPAPPNTNTAPIITLNPFDQTNSPGYNVALLAAATSNPAATWQWFKTGSGLISGATNALYIPTNSGTAGVAGDYFAIATNLEGSATTTVAVVTFQSAPLPPDWSVAFATEINNNNTPSTNYNIACLLDATGTNIYTVGSVVGTNLFGSDPLVSADNDSGSTFLKQTTDGTPLWGRSITNIGTGSSYAECVASAPGGGIYAAGDYFGTNWLGTNALVDVGGGSTYLIRFDSNGTALWIRTIAGTNGNFTSYHCLASDPAGNVTVSALISGGTQVGTSNVFVSGQKGVLAQFDANGNLRWLQLPSGWPGSLVYNNGNIYGSMGGNNTNYIGGVTNVSDLHQALLSINATNGQGNWVRGMAANINNGNPYGFADDGAVVAVSGTNIFVAGIAWGSNAMFGTYTVNFPDAKGLYLARFDTNGNAQLATSFGSEYSWPWAIQVDAAGNVYVGSDFDTYAIFGNDILAAPFYDTVQSLGSFAPGAYIPGQTCVAKFDRNGNPLWARLAQSLSSDLNSRDIALASDGVWSCGFFNQQSVFGALTINGNATCNGSPTCVLEYHPNGYLAKIVDASASASAVTLLNPQNSGANFQFQFLTQLGFTHNILYRTNLTVGTWLTNSTVTGNGTVTNISLPYSIFSPAKQGFIRVSTQ